MKGSFYRWAWEQTCRCLAMLNPPRGNVDDEHSCESGPKQCVAEKMFGAHGKRSLLAGCGLGSKVGSGGGGGGGVSQIGAGWFFGFPLKPSERGSVSRNIHLSGLFKSNPQSLPWLTQGFGPLSGLDWPSQTILNSPVCNHRVLWKIGPFLV